MEKSKIENVEKNVVSFEFKVDAAKFENAVEQAYKKNRSKINIQGFRKGKAPRAIIENYYGKEVFYEDAVNIVLPEAYDEFIKENEVDAVSQPEIDIKEISKENGVTFTAKVTVKPEVKLGTYKGVEVKKVTYRTTEKDINAELDKMRERNSRMVPVEGRPVQDGDTATIDFEGFKDGVAFEGGKGENYDLVIGSGSFIPGFEEQLIGANAGDDVEVNVTFPEEYHSEELKGQKAVFKVKVHEIKAKELPELDDEFAKDVSEFDTLDELKADIKKNLKEANQTKAKNELEDKIMATICDSTEVDIPDVMVDNMVDSMLRDFDMQMQYQGLNLQTYLSYTGMTLDSLKAQYKEEAAKRVKNSLVLEAIGKAENITAEDSDVEAEYKNIADKNGMKPEDIKKYVNESDIKDKVRVEKTIKFIVDNASIK